MTDLVTLESAGGVARLRIQNPPLNILTNATRRALFETARGLQTRDDLSVVILEAAGEKAFSVGSDIGEFPEDELGGVAKIRFEQYLLDTIAGLPQVVIAKLRGFALGGGGELMLASDLRIAARDAQIGFPEIRLGALPAAGGIKRLVQEVGPVRARELVMTGLPISAERAYAIGLITEVVDAAALDTHVDELADHLAALPRTALGLAKRCIAAAQPQTRIDTAEAEAFGALFRGTDIREGLAAFLEKRPPRFNR